MLYRFDGIDDALTLLPLAARRALDTAGRKLSREGWNGLPLPVRRQIVALGAAALVDPAAVRALLAPAVPAPKEIEPLGDEPREHVPDAVRTAFGVGRPLTDAVWSTLTPLDRYALAKVVSSKDGSRLAGAYDEIVGHTAVSTHLAASGGARMVDVAEKPVTHRRAVAESRVTMSAAAFERLARADVAKGDVLGTARLAGIQAAKRTADLVPLCHPVRLSRVAVELELVPAEYAVRLVAVAEAMDRTGVEMEALTAVSVAALTVYDMLKGIDRSMVIGPTVLAEKSGGRSGDYAR